MAYNGRVEKARDSIGKKVPDGTPDAVKEYLRRGEAANRARKLAKLQYAYSRFLEKNTMTRKEFVRISNYSDDATRATLTELEDMGLLTSAVLLYECNTKLYSIVDPKYIPEGWPPRGELLNMVSPYKGYRYIPRGPKQDGADKEEAADNPLTRMRSNRNLHVEDTSGYENLMKDTSKFYGNEELDSLIASVHEMCRTRIEQRYVECPLCKGRLQRENTGIYCVNCRLRVDGGTFENSLRMATVIAKNGIKVR